MTTHKGFPNGYDPKAEIFLEKSFCNVGPCSEEASRLEVKSVVQADVFVDLEFVLLAMESMLKIQPSKAVSKADVTCQNHLSRRLDFVC